MTLGHCSLWWFHNLILLGAASLPGELPEAYAENWALTNELVRFVLHRSWGPHCSQLLLPFSVEDWASWGMVPLLPCSCVVVISLLEAEVP